MKKIITTYNNYNQRYKYLKFLFIREFDKWRSDLKNSQREKRKFEKRQVVGCFDEMGQLQYGNIGNTLFHLNYRDSVKYYSLHRLRQAKMLAQKIVFDCSYDQPMIDYETTAVARQLFQIYNTNRYSKDPFNIMFTDFRPSNRCYQYFVKHVQYIVNRPEFFVPIHQESYMDLLEPDERQRLIYLSPNARKLMDHFDPNAIYIIGAIVDKTFNCKFSLEKAKQHEIECLRLPIHHYVQTKANVKKKLTFSGVFNILYELREHGNWDQAIRKGLLPHQYIKEEEDDDGNK